MRLEISTIADILTINFGAIFWVLFFRCNCTGLLLHSEQMIDVAAKSR